MSPPPPSRTARLALALAAAAPAIAAGAGTTVYRGATVVDVRTGEERTAMAILTQGERIVRIAPQDRIDAPPGAEVVETAGLWAIPGLINSHEHLATPPDRPRAEAQMRRDLYGGITGMRDMADDLRQIADLARAALVGEIPGPDIAYAALMAGPVFFDDARTHDVTRGAVAGAVPWMRAVDARTNLPIAVAEAHGTGASAIKIYADLPAERVAAITAEAHRQGLRVWAHAAVFPASPREVIDAGVDTISHAGMLAYQASPTMPQVYAPRPPVEEDLFAAGTPVTVRALFDDLRRRGTVLDATLWVYEQEAMAHAADPRRPSPYCSLALAERLTGEAWRAGVAISAGTDGFSARRDPWPALQDELILLHDGAGLSLLATLQAATLVGARAMGTSADMGTLESGKLADIAFLAKDPLAEVGAYKSVVLTVKRGVAYRRSAYQPEEAR
jgi:imidazolonepropionase-like amidohydrolase